MVTFLHTDCALTLFRVWDWSTALELKPDSILAFCLCLSTNSGTTHLILARC